MFSRLIVFLNYHLHRIYALSICLSANLAEVLQSSHTVLEMQAAGFKIWSSWDLVVRSGQCLG